MDKNTFLAFLLIFLVWTVWQSFQPPPRERAPHIQETTPLDAEKMPSPLLRRSLSVDGKASSNLPVAAPSEAPKKIQILENDLLRIKIGSDGGQLEEIVLKKFRTKVDEHAPPLTLIPENTPFYPFVLSLSSLGEEGAPESFLGGFQEVEFSETDQRALYRFSAPDMLEVEREYNLKPGSYVLESAFRLRNLHAQQPLKEQPGLFWSHWASPQATKRVPFFSSFVPPDIWQSLALFSGNKLEKNSVKPGERKLISGPVTWASLGNRYFLMAVFPEWEGIKKLQIRNAEVKGGTLLSNHLFTNQVTLPPHEQAEFRFRVYLGPKDLKLLEAQGNHLDRSLDLGMFEFFALFLLRMLRLFYALIPNWGISIILLTVAVKIAFFPLTHKSFKSMKEMQRIQPLLNEIKERYKDNKEQYNIQMMKVMKEHKVNPLGGCLPILIQMPIYIALYKVLYSSIELRQAGFVFWIRDLSERDPYFISPIILGVAMFLQQRLSPKPPDPVQAKMMMIMPIMFSVFMLFLPSGLVVYILCNTVLSMLQQVYVNRTLGEKSPLPTLAENQS